MTGFVVAAVGCALVVAALVVLFGAWAAVASGVVLVVAGLGVDWEALNAEHHGPPPRRDR